MVLGIPGVQHGARAVLDERQANLRPRRRVQITLDVEDFGTNGDRSSTIGGEHPPGVTSDFRAALVPQERFTVRSEQAGSCPRPSRSN